jgi:hypothetical protein
MSHRLPNESSMFPASIRHTLAAAQVIVLAGLGQAGWAKAQQCPSEYTACDNGGCCLSSEQCCPTAAEGCCSSSTPYCCGDGTCAATPSQCASTGGRAACDGYDVPCGGGCAPAGSDCCDLAGHYCPPESMCTSETTCVFGDTPTLAREVALTPLPEEVQGPGLAPPFRDPEDATKRSCSLGLPAAAEPSRLGWLALAAALLAGRRTSRAPREARAPKRAGR